MTSSASLDFTECTDDFFKLHRMSSLSINELDPLSKSTHTRPSVASVPTERTSLEEQTNWIVAETRRTVATLQRDSEFFSKNQPRPLPTFQETELLSGEALGNGQFGMVFEVKGIDLKDGDAKQRPSVYADDLSEDEFPTSLDNKQIRQYMSCHVVRDGRSRFAVKRVRPDLTDEDKAGSAVDLAVEAKFLACMDHSNIVKLRATVGKPGHDSFMIVLDRLHTILNETIEIWRQEANAARGLFGLKVTKKVGYYKAKTERLVALFDIARALKYLHNLNILYRDLKPENIGCDVRGDYKIFDFGLAKELKQNLLRAGPDGYECTGRAGTRRWMAPEVCMCKIYGLSADVYSFSLLFYYLMTLEIPYHKYDLKKHMDRVIVGGERPNGNRIKTSEKLREAIVQGWSENPHKRPSMEHICGLIEEEVVARKQDVKKNKRRSTIEHIKNRSIVLKRKSQRSTHLTMIEECENGKKNTK